jgi:pimeloyl-ACP methyl ester carboxylesterase
MRRSEPVDGFSLAYERVGAGPAVLLLHGWPGDHGDYRAVTPLLSERAQVLTPDLRGFGVSRGPRDRLLGRRTGAQRPRAPRRARLRDVVIAGYDIGSRIAQTVARTAPDHVRAIVVCPPVPGPANGS